MLQIECLTINPWEENTFIMYDNTKQAAVIDCGCYTQDEEQLFLDRVAELGLTVTHILQTHLHLDHVFGYAFLHKTYGLEAYAHRADEFFLDNLYTYAQSFGLEIDKNQPKIGTYINDGDVIRVGNTELECIHLPGHSPGGVCFYAKKDKAVFSGDCIFREGIGRTDLMKGNHSDLLTNLKEKLLSLPNEVKIFPGHGPSTTIGHEKLHNPFLAPTSSV